MQDTPLLTLGIIQWDKAHWLETCLYAIAKQLRADSPVEVIICDDGIRTQAPLGGLSQEKTESIIHRVFHQPELLAKVSYHRRNDSEQPGIPENITRLVKRANGKFLWCLGNDDIMLTGAIDLVLKAIQAHHDIQLIYFVYARVELWKIKKPIYNIEEHLAVLKNFGRLESGRLEQFAEVVRQDRSSLASTYSTIIRLQHWCNIAADFQKIFLPENDRWSWDLLARERYIADHLLDKPAYYIAPCILYVSYNVTWNKEEGSEQWKPNTRKLKFYLDDKLKALGY